MDLVANDDQGGLKSAIQQQFHGASWQRCQTRFSKNVSDKAPKKVQAKVKTGLGDMYNAPGLKAALERKDRLLGWMTEQAPEAAEILDEGFDDVTAGFGLPTAYRKRLRTTSSIERLNEELRRRERVTRILPNEASLIRLMGSVLMDIHEKWMSGKKYFTMDKYYEEREAAKKKAKEDRPKHLHIVS